MDLSPSLRREGEVRDFYKGMEGVSELADGRRVEVRRGSKDG